MNCGTCKSKRVNISVCYSASGPAWRSVRHELTDVRSGLVTEAMVASGPAWASAGQVGPARAAVDWVRSRANRACLTMG